MLASLQVVDRRSGRAEPERVYNQATLTWLYQRQAGRLLLDTVLTRRWFSTIYASWRRSRLSRRSIAAFAAEAGIEVAEAERPLSAYRSVDDFFTRRLRPGARPVDRDPRHLVCPADGRLLVAARVGDRSLPVKGQRIDLADLVDDGALAARYRDGCAFVLRLAVSDYHRFHFPDAGVASAARQVDGRLHSVHPIALDAGAPSFRNKRAVCVLDSDGFGRVALVEVGAITVGTIVQTYRPGRVERGAEKGTFRMGGSTIVMLLEPGRVRVDEDLLARSALDLPSPVETQVRMGTRIGCRP